MIKRKAIIISILGTELTNDEKKLIKTHKPWGVILFKRNCKTAFQTKKLILNIRKVVQDKKYPILIDEEGIKVSRLSNFFKIVFRKNILDLYIKKILNLQKKNIQNI